MKKLIKKIGAVFLSLTVAASLLAGCGAKKDEVAAVDTKGTFRTLEEIKSSGTINIGVFSDKSPFGYVDENGQYQGYDVYFGNRIGQDLGVKINYVSPRPPTGLNIFRPARWTLSSPTSLSPPSGRRRWISLCPT